MRVDAFTLGTTRLQRLMGPQKPHISRIGLIKGSGDEPAHLGCAQAVRQSGCLSFLFALQQFNLPGKSYTESAAR